MLAKMRYPTTIVIVISFVTKHDELYLRLRNT